MPQPAFVPDDFVPPTRLDGDGFHLEPLGARHNRADYAAWMSSIAHIRATPGFQNGSWPPPTGMTPAENLRDLERHAADFEERTGFTFTVIDSGGDGDDAVIGCVYIYPARPDPGAAVVRSWVSADRAELDGPLHEAVAAWLVSHWPFGEIRYRTGS